MRNLYIVPDNLTSALHSFCKHHHFISIGNGFNLCSIEFLDNPNAQLSLEAHPEVQTVGHEFDPSPIEDTHADKLAGHGVKRGHTAKHVRLAAKKFHKLM